MRISDPRTDLTFISHNLTKSLASEDTQSIPKGLKDANNFATLALPVNVRLALIHEKAYIMPSEATGKGVLYF